MILGGGKQHFTAAELAELKLPGLPTTKRKINERAASECWALRVDQDGTPLARSRPGRGGDSTEYHVTVLPAAARAALAGMGVSAVAHVSHAAETEADAVWRAYDALSATAKSEAERRAAILADVERHEAVGLTRSAAVAAAAARAKVGASTLWGWFQLIDGIAPTNRLPYLAPRRGGGGAEAAVDQQAWQVLLSDYLRPEQPTFASCYRRALEWAQANGIELPVAKTLQRKLEREVPRKLVIAKRKGAEALRQTLPPQQRSVAALHALEAVNIDGHTFDVFVEWEDGTIGRPVMVGIQDLYSRKLLAWRIDRSETAVLTRLAFADLFKNWGIPKRALMDNGRAFASKWISGGAKSRYRFKIRDEEPTGVLTGLGIQINWALPYRGQSKPIERYWRDLADVLARHPATSGAYTGNRPDAKPENYGGRAVPIATFRVLANAVIASANARLGRRTETTQGGSFDDTFAKSYAVSPIGKATPEQLRFALLTAEDRPCDRKSGFIMLEGNRYWSHELSEYAGKRVTVRFDPDNLHSEIHVYDRQGAFIVTAPVIEATGFFDKSAANARRKLESDLKKRVKEADRLADLIDAAQVAAMLPDHAEDVAPVAPVVRPVRHRGQTAAALKHNSEAVQAPLNPVIDRLERAMLRVVK